MEKYIRTDFVFSYWIFAWFLLYMIGFIKTSPKFALMIALFVLFIISLFLIMKGASINGIALFLIINCIIKVIPLYFVWNTKITNDSILSTLLLFVIYLLWLKVNNVNGYKTYNNFINSFISNKKGTPTYPTYVIMRFYDWIMKK